MTTAATRELSFRTWALVIAGYVVVALVQSWPLSLHLDTHITGPPGSDAGVYVWNVWVFRHELEHGRSPFSTEAIFALAGRGDLSLHNYTVFANLLALPLQRLVGVIASFNVAYLANFVLAAIGMFVLARAVTTRTAESWLAGLLFACSPFLIARGNIHFSLAAAAPLPFFVHWLRLTWATHRIAPAAATGAAVAWAAYSDPYYAIYCVMLGLTWMACECASVDWIRVRAHRVLRAGVTISIGIVAAVTIGLYFFGGRVLDLGQVRLSVQSLYTPVLLITVLSIVRVALEWWPRVSWQAPPSFTALARCGAVSILAATFLLAPVLVNLGRRSLEGAYVEPPILWRSSPPGVDLLSFALPNPNHPLAPPMLIEWLDRQPGFFVDSVASLPFVGLLVIAIARRRASFTAPPFWLIVTVGFAVLALGPFVHFAGVRTYVPTPWSLLRFVPVIGEARMPSRFAVLAVMGLAILFASALTALTRRFPRRRRAALAAVGVALGLELLAAPRQLFSAEPPAFLATLAGDPRDIRVLDLPFGLRDGLSSLGDASAESQVHQTVHGKPTLGGYLSRVTDATKAHYLGIPMTRVLIALSERREPSETDLEQARSSAGAFTRDASLGYVVMNTARVSQALRTFAIETLRLTHVASDRGFDLFEVAADEAPTRSF